MFVRVKSTPKSPRKSVQIVESFRVNGKVRQRIVQHVGVAQDEESLRSLKELAESIKCELEQRGRLPLYPPGHKSGVFQKDKEDSDSEDMSPVRDEYNVNLLDIVEESREIKGIHDIYGKLYDEFGFDKVIANPARNRRAIEILKDITMARIANPSSKRGSVDDLSTHFGIDIDLKSVYRMMDKIDEKAISRINTLAWQKCQSLFKEKIDVLYFDATTLYFESFDEDDLRRNGYSKDKKFNQPQVVLALLVSKEGLPVGYRLFSGDTFDGHTLMPTLKELKAHYDLDRVVYVADSGMFNKKNLEELEALERENTAYIVGARIKSMPESIKRQILDISNYRSVNDDLSIASFDYKGRKLIVSHSRTRARKDAHDRQKGIQKIQKKLERSSAVKSHLSNQGYRKYLKIEADNKCKEGYTLHLDEAKMQEDEKWDGLKGILTNDKSLGDIQIIEQYANLWQIEESFRITKHDLKIRPIYHYKPERVKAHIAITFMAYTLVRHLSYRVSLQYKKLSPARIRQLLLDVQVSKLYDKAKGYRFTLPSSMPIEAEKIYKIIRVKPQKRPQRI